jgi:diguanylate cyclase (GGDEF)-like protein
VPLATQGELHGLLHLHGIPASDADKVPDAANHRRQLIHSASEHISLSIANLKLQDHLRQQSIRDILTGLYNRRHMEESLRREIARADRSGKPCGVIMVDVDHFKKFNDSYGHQAGDALLKGLGAFMQRHVRGEDIPCRYGGEEFILILPGADAEGAYKRAEQIRAEVETSLKVPYDNGFLPQVTISLGVACYPIHAQSAEQTVKAADAALYHSKQDGRNRVSVSAGDQGAD